MSTITHGMVLFWCGTRGRNGISSLDKMVAALLTSKLVSVIITSSSITTHHNSWYNYGGQSECTVWFGCIQTSLPKPSVLQYASTILHNSVWYCTGTRSSKRYLFTGHAGLCTLKNLRVRNFELTLLKVPWCLTHIWVSLTRNLSQSTTGNGSTWLRIRAEKSHFWNQIFVNPTLKRIRSLGIRITYDPWVFTERG